MITEITSFQWHVYSGGYKCQDVELKGRTCRMIALDWENPRGSSLTPCSPMETPGLYREFAALKLTEKEIVRFANKWGPLKQRHEFDDTGDDFDEEDIGNFSWVSEEVNFWFEQIKRMKATLRLWQILKSGTERDLLQLIELEKLEGTTYWWVQIRIKKMPKLGRDYTFRERDCPGLYDQLDQGGTRDLAKVYLFDLINESLWGTCSPWLRIGDKLDDIAWCFSPHDLNGALWLMFAQELLGEKKIRQCVYCKGFFDVAKEEDQRRQRSDKKYCSTKCRLGAFRERHDSGLVELPKKRAASPKKPKGAASPKKPK